MQPIVVERGLGSWVWDTKGEKYLDMTTGVCVGARTGTAMRVCIAHQVAANAIAVETAA